MFDLSHILIRVPPDNCEQTLPTVSEQEIKVVSKQIHIQSHK